MKKSFLLTALIFLVGAAAASAAGLALIYDDEQAVTAGRARPAPVSGGGAAIASDVALAASSTLLYGDGDGLFRGSISKLDNDLNLAIIRRGERLEDAALQSAHAGRWKSSVSFLAVPAGAAAAEGGPEVVTIAPTPEGGPFLIKMNGHEAGNVPVVLNERFKKSRVRLEVVNTSTVPLWGVNLELTSQPELSFWKEGRRTGLNDVPTKKFEYVHQAVFRSLKPGAKFTVPIEVYFIKDKNYVWTFNVTSKDLKIEQKTPVRFE